jgi:uncharacterized protein YdeI (YjbR/CyaY-like superfamily)
LKELNLGIILLKKDLLKIKSFKSSLDCRKWFIKNHSKSDGIWIRIFKKTSAVKSITYAEALDQALCYGWIDGQKQKYDEQSWLQRFTPRRAKSNWSKINTQHAERLIKSGKMASAGLKAIESAKADGRWKAAYDSPSNTVIPKDFLNELRRNKKALEFFKSLNKANQYAIAYRLQTAKKPETRAKRMKLILEMMRKGKKFH